MKHLNKKIRSKFVELIKSGLQDILKPSINHYQYSIDTKYGILSVTIDGNDYPCVFTRFENPELVKTLDNRVNPFSGKWNFHPVVHELTVEMAAMAIVNEIRGVTA